MELWVLHCCFGHVHKVVQASRFVRRLCGYTKDQERGDRATTVIVHPPDCKAQGIKHNMHLSVVLGLPEVSMSYQLRQVLIIFSPHEEIDEALVVRPLRRPACRDFSFNDPPLFQPRAQLASKWKCVVFLVCFDMVSSGGVPTKLMVFSGELPTRLMVSSEGATQTDDFQQGVPTKLMVSSRGC